MSNVRKMVFLSLFIALEVVLTRFLSVQTPIVRIGFTFLPIAISSMMFGPIFGGVAAALADIIGMMVFPSGGAYFPGFTLTAFLSGVIYGVVLYKKPKNLVRISISAIIVSIVINLGLDTVWLMILTGKGFIALLPARIIKCLVMIPIQIPMIHIVWNYTVGRLDFNYATKGVNA
ncbi:ECF transporter S component (folate family) [Anaerosolibacter carboniphilus]|uniref:ECF transporter S component (Folate family) n=1 Tax=Anaerosolibacter carboniphilus TaxID=1417629 RepID=A0A841KYC9_9FIRM|nr:ECF transporter S component (folate family) [Anaerosolibacter carboniphilus]